MGTPETTNLRLLFYVFVIFLGACHPAGSLMKEMRMADSMMEEHPDTALYILQRIADVEEMKDDEYAAYCLLRTKAEDINKVPHTSDSLISTAVEYFSAKDRPYMTAKAYYYLARVNEDMGKDSLAERNYLLSLSAIEKLNKYKETALIYSRLSQVYLRLQRYDEAMEMQQKSYNNRLMADSEKVNTSWIIIAIAVVLIFILLFLLWRYKARFRKKEKQMGKQERQLNAAKQTITEQKAEISKLSNELYAIKKGCYSSSEIVKKIHAINTTSITSKEKTTITELEWNLFLNMLEDTFGFISTLKQSYPKLSDIDIRICALLKEGVVLTHIESILGMTHDTLLRRMQRIKNEKMGLGGQNTTLEVIIKSL